MAQGDRVYLGLIQINAWSNEETVIIFNDGENGTIEDTFIFTDMKNVSVLAERTRSPDELVRELGLRDVRLRSRLSFALRAPPRSSIYQRSKIVARTIG